MRLTDLLSALAIAAAIGYGWWARRRVLRTRREMLATLAALMEAEGVMVQMADVLRNAPVVAPWRFSLAVLRCDQWRKKWAAVRR